MLRLDCQPRHSMHRPRANSILCLSLTGFRVRCYGRLQLMVRVSDKYVEVASSAYVSVSMSASGLLLQRTSLEGEERGGHEGAGALQGGVTATEEEYGGDR